MGAVYDAIADWYENDFLGPDEQRAADPLEIDRCLRGLLGPGTGVCLEVGCGTGAHAATVRSLGWTPVGVDISAAMLGYARGRLAIARADAERLPFRDASLPAVISVMVHTDMPGYVAVAREAARVLRPGGAFVHVGVHPCFCGGFADWTDKQAIVIRPGYSDRHWTKASWTDKGVRDKVGATHFPLPSCCTRSPTPAWSSTASTKGAPPPRRCSPSGAASRALKARRPVSGDLGRETCLRSA